MNKFHSKEYWLMSQEDLDPDIALSFILRTPQELEILINKIK